MTYKNLIEQQKMHLETHKKVVESLNGGMCALDCANAATASETLRADLARVTAERDAAVYAGNHLKAVKRDEGIVVKQRKYPWERPEWNR